MPCLSRMAEGAKIIVYLQTKFLYIFYYDTSYYNEFYTKVRNNFGVIEIFTTFAHRNQNSIPKYHERCHRKNSKKCHSTHEYQTLE